MGGGEITPHEAAAAAAATKSTPLSRGWEETNSGNPGPSSLYETPLEPTIPDPGPTFALNVPHKRTFTTSDGIILPAGWEARAKVNEDGTKGPTYYVNHNKRETSWANPAHQITSIIPDGDPLPTGWEARCKITSDGFQGRMYFVNHIKRETSWIDPRSEVYEKVEQDVKERGPLPQGWEMRWKGGRKYFVNHTERRTTWDDPRSLA